MPQSRAATWRAARGPVAPEALDAARWRGGRLDTSDTYTLLGPLLVALLVAEAAISGARGRQAHHLPDTLANLDAGLGQVLFGIFTGAGLLAVYDGFQAALGVSPWPTTSPLAWVVALFGIDLCYYAFHRGSHRVAALWALHEVHHQSNELNLSVALRQTWFSDLSACLFYWPLPLLGVPRDVFFVTVGLLSLWQALLHQRFLEGRGPWAAVFNVPAHHAVHHASDDGYRDRNFGNLLIVWDRLFGTFTPQTTTPTFGISPPFRSHDPVEAQLSPLRALARRARAAPTLADALRVLLSPPDWLAPWERPSSPSTAPHERRPVPFAVGAYAVAQWVVLAAAALAVLASAFEGTPPWRLLPHVAALVAGTISLAGLLEQRRGAAVAEGLRLAATAAIFLTLPAWRPSGDMGYHDSKEVAMAQLIVRNLDDELVEALKARAAAHGRSAEAEHRAILDAALRGPAAGKSLWEWLAAMPGDDDDDDFARPRDLPRDVDL